MYIKNLETHTIFSCRCL